MCKPILGDPGADIGGGGGVKVYKRAGKNGAKKSKEHSLLFFAPISSVRLDFSSPPLSAPGSPRMVQTWILGREDPFSVSILLLRNEHFQLHVIEAKVFQDLVSNGTVFINPARWCRWMLSGGEKWGETGSGGGGPRWPPSWKRRHLSSTSSRIFENIPQNALEYSHSKLASLRWEKTLGACCPAWSHCQVQSLS